MTNIGAHCCRAGTKWANDRFREKQFFVGRSWYGLLWSRAAVAEWQIRRPLSANRPPEPAIKQSAQFQLLTSSCLWKIRT